jgi:D-beta-D-heptose 7-phosphate kinase/D-beta-D-heptose 1-phosphate adenosyltransferase
MLDVYQYGKCNRISPEAPVPVVDFFKEEKMLGGAGNVLRNLVSLGAKCDIITVIGVDLAGSEISEQLSQFQIESKLIVLDNSRKTTEKKRVVCSGQQLIRIDKEDRHPINFQIENDIIEFVRQNISEYRAIVFSDYSKGVLTDKVCLEIISIARMNKILTMLDPKGSNFRKYKNIDLIKPNLKEAEILIGRSVSSRDEIHSVARNLKELLGCKYVLITLAEDGIALLEDEFEIISTRPCPVYDVSGAGDTVLASLALCLLHDFSLRDACKFANTAASIVIQKFGAATTTVEDVIKEM